MFEHLNVIGIETSMVCSFTFIIKYISSQIFLCETKLKKCPTSAARHIYAWKAKVGISISFITAIFYDILKKPNRPLDSSSNSLSKCLFWFHIAFILEKNMRVKQERVYDHIPNRSIFSSSFCLVF